MSASYDLIHAHDLCFGNKSSVESAKTCGCFYCKTVYPASKVREYLHENTGMDTAVCPRCGIDAVIADNQGVMLTQEFLNTGK